MAGISRSTAGIGAFGLACFAAGAALGLGAERLVVNRTFRYDPDAGEAYGQLHAEAHRLVVPDGTGLHVEVDTRRGFRAGRRPDADLRPRLQLQQRLLVLPAPGPGRAWGGSWSTTSGRTAARTGRRMGPTPSTSSALDLSGGHGRHGTRGSGHPDRPLDGWDDRDGIRAALPGTRSGPGCRGLALLSTSAGGLDTVTFGLPRPARALMRSVPGRRAPPWRPRSSRWWTPPAIGRRTCRRSADQGLLVRRLVVASMTAVRQPDDQRTPRSM